MVSEEVFVKCYKFNPISKVKKATLKCLLLNFPKPQFGFAARQSQSQQEPKK
jgi:hypothetical protein